MEGGGLRGKRLAPSIHAAGKDQRYGSNCARSSKRPTSYGCQLPLTPSAAATAWAIAPDCLTCRSGSWAPGRRSQACCQCRSQQSKHREQPPERGQLPPLHRQRPPERGPRPPQRRLWLPECGPQPPERGRRQQPPECRPRSPQRRQRPSSSSLRAARRGWPHRVHKCALAARGGCPACSSAPQEPCA